MKHVEYYYKDVERYKSEMKKYTSLKDSTIKSRYYRIKKYISEGRVTVDELYIMTQIQRNKLIVFHDMKRFGRNVNNGELIKHGFNFEEIGILRERGLI